MRLNLDKSLAWALKKADRRDLKRRLARRHADEAPKISTGERLLGAQMQYSAKHPGKTSLQPRLQQAENACVRIGSVPLGIFQRGELTEAVVMPKVLYDCPISPLSKRAMTKWRAAAARATWGGGSRFRCNETMFTLLCHGHAVDPLQASVLRILKTTKRMLSKHPKKAQKFLSTTTTRRGARARQFSNIIGPCRQFLWALETVGWTMDLDATFSHRNP